MGLYKVYELETLAGAPSAADGEVYKMTGTVRIYKPYTILLEGSYVQSNDAPWLDQIPLKVGPIANVDIAPGSVVKKLNITLRQEIDSGNRTPTDTGSVDPAQFNDVVARVAALENVAALTEPEINALIDTKIRSDAQINQLIQSIALSEDEINTLIDAKVRSDAQIRTAIAGVTLTPAVINQRIADAVRTDAQINTLIDNKLNARPTVPAANALDNGIMVSVNGNWVSKSFSDILFELNRDDVTAEAYTPIDFIVSDGTATTYRRVDLRDDFPEHARFVFGYAAVRGLSGVSKKLCLALSDTGDGEQIITGEDREVCTPFCLPIGRTQRHFYHLIDGAQRVDIQITGYGV